MVSLRDGCRFEVSSVKQERPGRMPEAKGAKRTQSRPAGVPDGANRAKRTQTWGTWGISASAVSCGPRLGRGVERAKRTQFGAAGAGAGGERRKTNPIWPACPGMGAGWRAAMPARRAIAQNEPNLNRPGARVGDEMRKTNPISPRRGA
jgi:hypothetical protein